MKVSLTLLTRKRGLASNCRRDNYIFLIAPIDKKIYRGDKRVDYGKRVKAHGYRRYLFHLTGCYAKDIIYVELDYVLCVNACEKRAAYRHLLVCNATK